MPSEAPQLIYRPLIPPLADQPLTSQDESGLELPDRRDGRIYHYDEHLLLALQIALATGRPLLLRGDPGSGKSSFAAYVARNLHYRYYEYTVTSQTNAQDLLWKFDLVRRLADAQTRTASAPTPLNDFDYVEPGILWWVFNRETAAQRGWAGKGPAPKALAVEPDAELNLGRDQERTVVLIDELDKADPDVPNALLVPLGSLKFRVTDIEPEFDVQRPAPAPPVPLRPSANAKATLPAGISRLLVVITTNEEKELPGAFLRRCIVHRLDPPGVPALVEIARRHFDRPGSFSFESKHEAVATQLATRLAALRTERREAGRRPPGTAEFLDAMRACLALGLTDLRGSTWQALEQATILKDAPPAV